MARSTLFIVPLAFVLISTNVRSQGIGANVENGHKDGSIGANVETGHNIEADFIHELTKQMESKLDTKYSELSKIKLDDKIVRNFIDLTNQLTKDEVRYLIQEIQRSVENQPRSRIARQTNTTPPVKITKITYTLGKRATGDRIIASNSANEQFSAAQNVTQTLTYPRNGVGSIITYVEIIVEQSSNLGRASAPTGGIDQRSISVVLEAQNTLLYRSTAAIYGY